MTPKSGELAALAAPTVARLPTGATAASASDRPAQTGRTGRGQRGQHDAGDRAPAFDADASRFPAQACGHTVYDTTSILATNEPGNGLVPLTQRDAAVNDLRRAVRTGGR